jgi:excisionase family DNA binding protein
MKILTTREVAELLQTSSDMVERLIKMGELHAERLTPRGRYRISAESVYAYAKRQKITLKTPQRAV